MSKRSPASSMQWATWRVTTAVDGSSPEKIGCGVGVLTQPGASVGVGVGVPPGLVDSFTAKTSALPPLSSCRNGARRGREVAGGGLVRHVAPAQRRPQRSRNHPDSIAAQEGGIGQRVAGRVQPGHESVISEAPGTQQSLRLVSKAPDVVGKSLEEVWPVDVRACPRYPRRCPRRHRNHCRPGRSRRSTCSGRVQLGDEGVPWRLPPLKLVSKAPDVVGKLLDAVPPVR